MFWLAVFVVMSLAVFLTVLTVACYVLHEIDHADQNADCWWQDD